MSFRPYERLLTPYGRILARTNEVSACTIQFNPRTSNDRLVRSTSSPERHPSPYDGLLSSHHYIHIRLLLAGCPSAALRCPISARADCVTREEGRLRSALALHILLLDLAQPDSGGAHISLDSYQDARVRSPHFTVYIHSQDTSSFKRVDRTNAHRLFRP